MPRSSRSKSHKQSKHREYSGSDEDVKLKEKERSSNGGKEDAVSVRVSKDSSGRKHGKDLSNAHANGDVIEEHPTSLKRREEKSHGGSDRWNGGSSDDKGLVINIEDKELVKVKDQSKGESKGESKSKSSRRHDADSVSVTVPEKDESKSGNRGEKRKSDRESSRKESSQYKEHKESKELKESKDKDRGSDRGRRGHSDKVEAEAASKQVENQSSKKGKEITAWPIEEELRNPELEKELEKRMRRRGETSSAKDRYLDDIKETEDRQLSTRNSRSKDERRKNEEYENSRETRKKDEKHREDGDRKSREVKHRSESGRYNKHRDDKYDDKYHEDKYNEDGNKETKYKDEKYVENSDKDERNRDRKRRQDDDRDYKYEEKKVRVPEAKRARDDNVRKTNNRDGSPGYDDRVARYKDDKDSRRGNEKDESSDYRSRSSMKEVKEQRPESEKRSGGKADSVSEWGRHGSRYADVDIAASHSRRRSSPSGSSYPTRDHHRYSKQEETKYRDYAYEDRSRHNAHSSRDYESAPGQSDKKVTSKDDGYVGGDFSGEKRPRPESRSSPQVDKSPSLTSNERRNVIKSDARKSLDFEEPGPAGPRSGGSKDPVKDGKGSRELVTEAQVDNDNLSVSSPYTRNSHFSGNSKSFLPPPSPSSAFFGSTEDDRSKSNNRHRRMVDPNMNRGQGQSQSQGNWNNVPNWPSPMAAGGYIPFQHGPPPMFHPLMPQFPPQMYGRPPMKLNPGMPYHVPDHGRPLTWRNQVDESVPPSLHGWDANNANNAVFGDESHLYGRLDWDHRTQLSNRGWDQNGELWKNQNAGGSMDVQSGQQKDGYPGHRSNDENWSGQTGQPDEGEPNQSDMQLETLNLDKNDHEAQKVTESPRIFEAVNDNALISQAYLSRVDVSKDLTRLEVYDEFTSMMDLDQEAISDELDCKILFLEEGVDVDVTDNASLFTVPNDSVFQKAMFLYKKQKEDFRLTNTDKEKGSGGDNSADEVAAEDTVMEDFKENDEPTNKPEEAMNVDEEDDESTEVAVKESPAPCEVEDASESINDEKNGGGGDGCSLVLSDVATADVAVMPTESIDFGSVSLNRIHHHSPESTH